ncbi:uncharacterized protein YktB (UPF0637 family) [Scopulibacillus daqui]|uniref:UPF0637 protein JOD45_001896 n=1 Tax=Scopulibacillus daqui TaxID=1469162 RepID=A0ABS2Q053_9BACL|nr:DUF1054 domain-containing protein [Scopulibacillus daqui]MBM7645677.1 uncharacterized protein YktB (UPF0637 family) [Scopulibacillus daqui]
MDFSGFSPEDFDVFTIDGLDERMSAIKSQIRPKLETLGKLMSPALTAITGDDMYPHVAKHARRTVNPPDDTWVAFSHNARGYKKYPHFQIGLWNTHVFARFAIIYEAPIKASYARTLEQHANDVYGQIPNDFVWSTDYTKPDAVMHRDLSIEDFHAMLDRLANVKKAEILCGIHIARTDDILEKGDQLLKKFEQTFKTLAPLYEYAKEAAAAS